MRKFNCPGLTEAQAQVAYLQYVEGHSQQRVAEILGKTLKAVQRLSERAIAVYPQLREYRKHATRDRIHVRPISQLRDPGLLNQLLY